ncbi:CYFA0S04e01706g1_1 [Cyberlindnera fabianii]|uniref:CYFA0S04e01706g1_1 n=1 Tax=Cyberlindnera fabianii TaxID=36022 RepID=A0A061AQX7_CYBFA|nr:CYFA0S04e01706g1_1 [Cyberlindnera fabianii]
MTHKGAMPISKEVLTELETFHHRVALHYIQLGAPKAHHKRPRDEIDGSTIDAAVEAGIPDPTYITIGETAITGSSPWSEEWSEFGDGEVPIGEVTFKLIEDKILLRTKKRNKMRDQAIGVLHITDKNNKTRHFSEEAKFVTSAFTRSKHTIWYRFAQEPILTLHIDKLEGTVNFTINYSFQYLESLYFGITFENTLKLNDIMKEIAVLPEETPKPVTAKSFYDTITDKTSNYPKSDTTPMIPEMDSTLLRFQSTTVKWMLSRENMIYNDETHSVQPAKLFNGESYLQDEDLVRQRLDQLSSGFRLVEVPSLNQRIWYNMFTGNICTQETAKKFLQREPPPDRGFGLLSEEMGLGKTVEIVSLVVLNARPLSQLKETVTNPNNLRQIPKAKTTLIICPESILPQWFEEISVHAPGLTMMIYEGATTKYGNMSPTKIANMLSQYDIVLTSYNVLSREVHNAQYNPSRAKRQRRAVSKAVDFSDVEQKYVFDDDVKKELESIYEDVGALHNLFNTERTDYSSPLVLLEFWRIVLDEVQMVGTTVSNICKTATLIPRHHVWGVSGTPIRNSIDDLNSLLSFMKVHPFADRKRWGMLLKSYTAFKDFFGAISWRHTKAMVKDDIHIPSQERIMMSVPFGTVEQNNYEELYKQFLMEVGLDEMGNPVHSEWEPSAAVHESMRAWLTQLRRTCCHASFSREAVKGRSIGFQTMENVLKAMIDDARQEKNTLERDIIVADLEIGQVYEFERKPQDALDKWMSVAEDLKKKLEEQRTFMDSNEESDTAEIAWKTYRSTLELLHRAYFFIGSAHYQLYTPPIDILVPGIAAQFAPEGVDPRLFKPSYEELSELAQDVQVHRVLNREEMEHQEEERKYYAMAQELRRQLLAEPIKNVNMSFDRLNDDFALSLVTLDGIMSFEKLEFSEYRMKLSRVVDQLNLQAEVLNRWLKEMKKILSTPLLDTVTDPSGDEYEGSLYNQEHLSLLLTHIQRAITDRYTLVNGSTSVVSVEKVEDTSTTGALFDHEFSQKLQEDYPKLLVEDSLKDLVVASRSLLGLYENSREGRYFADLVMKAKNVFDSQRKTAEEFQSKFRIYNSVYNLKITYFRRLQEISDNVRAFNSTTHQRFDVQDQLFSLKRAITTKRDQITHITGRLRFLESLGDSSSLDEKDKICCICRGVITIGSLTPCGHRYCKECLSTWLHSKLTCPICNSRVRREDVYNFTFNREDIVVSHGGFSSDGTNKELSQLYTTMDNTTLAKLNEIPLKYDYGSKVNAIVRQVLWLKKRNPYVQIVVFSQWGQFLDLLGNSLSHNGIQHLGSKNTLKKNGGQSGKALMSTVSVFKKDPNITCFLLNAKADASGLNLVNATHVFLCEPLVQAALELQAISRIHRIGQKKTTTVWTFTVQETVEESILLLSARKRLEFKEQLESDELAKNTKKLVETNGERVEDKDLWNSFFSHKIGQLV